MTDTLSLWFLVGLVVCVVIIVVCLYRMPPVEVPDEERCRGCGRWIGHAWKCPER